MKNLSRRVYGFERMINVDKENFFQTQQYFN